MNVARFNIKRKAWIAAIDRAQWVVEHYPQTPQTPEALATLAYAYNEIGDKATSEQYVNLLKLNYPNLVRANGTVDLAASRHDASGLTAQHWVFLVVKPKPMQTQKPLQVT